MKCSLCGKDLSLTQYIWKNIPINGLVYSKVCDECAQTYLKAFIAENSPEFSREACSHPLEYQKSKDLLEIIRNEYKIK